MITRKFTTFPFGFSEAELSELKNILQDETRQAEINEGYRGLRGAEDAASWRDLPRADEAAEGVSRADRADRSETELAPLQQQRLKQRTEELIKRIVDLEIVSRFTREIENVLIVYSDVV